MAKCCEESHADSQQPSSMSDIRVCVLLGVLKKGGQSPRQGASANSFKESNVEKGMVLPFTPLTMTFHDVHYFVDCPPVQFLVLPACCSQL